MATSRSFGRSSLTMRSPIQTLPSVGSSSPAIILIVVVFPHPDGPRSTRNSLSETVKLWLSTATKDPHRFVTPSNLISAISEQPPSSCLERNDSG